MVAAWAKELTESVIGGAPFKIGDVVKHPDGRTVKITEGRYWGDHGLSNFWYWREVLKDGSLSDKVEHGYGWSTQPEEQKGTCSKRRRRSTKSSSRSSR